MKRTLAGIAGPIAVVAVGILLLLSTLDVLPWRIWDDLARYWPILVILLGLGILFRNLRGRGERD